jgi:transcription initiation factor TFIIIB Brf1 subunit/transcription initiation factor TFIIB
MCHNSVGDINGEVVAGVACASLRHEDEVPRTIVSRSRVCGMRQGNKRDYCRRTKRKRFHNNFSEALSKWRASLTKRIDQMGSKLNISKGRNGVIQIFQNDAIDPMGHSFVIAD